MTTLSLISCGSEKDTKTYVFAVEATWPPMEFVDDSGEMVGFDIDMIDAIAQKAGFEYELRNTGWDGIFAGLANGSYDGIISAVTITDERKAAMDFSQAYLNAGQILLVPAAYDGPATLESFSDKVLGAQQGTTGDFVIEDAGIERRGYDEIGLAVEDLVNGNLDGVVVDSITAADFVVMNPAYDGTLKVIGEPFTTEEFGIAVKKGNSQLLELVNQGLAAVLEDGTHEEIVETWLR